MFDKEYIDKATGRIKPEIFYLPYEIDEVTFADSVTYTNEKFVPCYIYRRK